MAEYPLVLVGGLGFIGEHLAYRLRRLGLEVIVLARSKTVNKRKKLVARLEKAGVRVVASQAGSITESDIEGLKPGVIYHLAGKASGSWRVQWEAHAGLAERVARVASRTGARVVYVSSIAVASDSAKGPPGSVVTEREAPPGPSGPFETIHSETKAAGERIISSRCRKWVIARPGLVYGPGEAHSEVKLLRLAAKMRVAPISAGVPIVNVANVADILAMAGEGVFDGKVVHLVSKYTLQDLSSVLCRGACIRVPVNRLLSLGRLAPRSSKLRLAWSLVRKKYRYSSAVLGKYPWTLGSL